MTNHGKTETSDILVVVCLGLLSIGFSKASSAPTENETLPFGVWWFAPFFSGGGYSSEAIGFIQSLTQRGGDKPDLQLTQHGDAFSREFYDGLEKETRQMLFDLSSADPLEKEKEKSSTVVICHSEPGAWALPAALYATTPCPPPSPPHRKPLMVIGRTTFETDRLSPEHVRRCNLMNRVWVPSRFNLDTFQRSGVLPEKLALMPEPVDVHFFDPTRAEPLLPRGITVTGPSMEGPDDFIFLSVFKWEARKGWDVLIKAFLQEFSATDPVALYLLTNAYHTKRQFTRKIRLISEGLDQLLVSQGQPSKSQLWPRVVLIDKHVPTTEMPGLYKAAGAFVLPSRGEGWGRPHVEAMAMGLPVIATNWSGPTEYMTRLNSYPLDIDGLEEITEGAFSGHMWAKPSLAHLRQLMRHAWQYPEEAADKGLQARQDMILRFSPSAIGSLLMEEFRHIASLIKLPRDEL